MSSRNVDPNEWAAKRKSALEHASRLREERKNHAHGPPEELTFAPQVNKRPSYLKDSNSSKNLNPNNMYVPPDPNSPMEQPLPGSRNQNPQNVHNNNNIGNSASNNPTSTGTYKGNIMQNAASNYLASNDSEFSPSKPQNRNQPNETDELFLNQLRSSGKISGPGWNTDTTSNGFGEPTPIPSRTNKSAASAGTGTTMKSSPRQRMETKSARISSNDYDDGSVDLRQSQSNSNIARKTIANANVSGGGLGGGNGNVQDSLNTSYGNSSNPPNPTSRLSLLKSKIKRTEVVRSSRQSGGADDDYFDQKDYPPQAVPRSAPAADYYQNQQQQQLPTQQNNMSSAYQQPLQPKKITPRTRTESAAPTKGFNKASLTNDMASISLYDKNTSSSGGGGGGGGDGSVSARNTSRSITSAGSQRIPKSLQQNNTVSAGNGYDFTKAQAEDAFLTDEGGGMDAVNLMECPDCGRKFNPVPFAKHVKICQKVFQKTRKVFDSSKMRVADNPELQKILLQKQKEEARANKKNTKAGGAAPTAAVAVYDDKPIGLTADQKKAKWKQDSMAFRDAMKAAREVTKAIASGAPLPPPVMSAPDPSLILCANCGRRFNAKAAERHIPQCANIIAKPSALKRGAGGGGGVNGSTPGKAMAKKGAKF